jgi:hypothetical protein
MTMLRDIIIYLAVGAFLLSGRRHFPAARWLYRKIRRAPR